MTRTGPDLRPEFSWQFGTIRLEVAIVMNRRYQVSASQTFGYAGYFFFYWRFN